MRRALRNLVLLAATLAGAGALQAQPPELRGLVGAARPAGCSDYRFLLWEFYRAELWSDAERLPGEAFALSLTYRASFSRDELVDSSIAEMARIAGRSEAAFA